MTLPPGPTTPRVVRMIRLITQPLDYLEAYYRAYGDIFAVGWQKPPAAVYVNHPEGIQQIFTASPALFQAGSGGAVLRDLLGDSSVLLLNGDRHTHQRKLLMPPFHGDRLKAYSKLICQITEEVAASLHSRQSFQVRPLMQEITLRVILQAVFGLQSGERFDRLRVLLNELLESLGSPIGAALLFFPALRQNWGRWTPWGKFLWLKQQVDRLLYDEIHDRRKNPDLTRTDVLTLLLSARDEAGQPMSDTELRDELITLLLAGHETTASALTWALYWIHSLPDVERNLRSQLQSLHGDDLGDDPEQIGRLPYLTALCQETLRLYPVALTAGVRILKAPYKIMGYELPAGTALFPCTYLVHHNEAIYPQSKQFRPERFLERSFSSSEFLPFGGGHRYCIGAALALLEMKLVLATLLQGRRFELPPQKAIEPVRRGLTLAPPGHFRLRVQNLVDLEREVLIR
ncbi:cytochrome P450 [Leptolyngbya sp. FACHB-711]|uniref:cytochrome P450 n=1 Tax=unclassified Leptolyngbya TaxID=2650499 RepID=UPI001688B2C9|nr:cytochrome P450 [Leptolyngbya sp. FACHB-711]MBD1851547.1 cytochrome P450 [Cyanobacteria bacterium FACHB-502]MBD2025026.1 cytochrome P450 [Leptolyngbya sp. FACHB-711]